MLEWITIVGKGAEVTSSHQARAPTLGELYIRSTSTGKIIKCLLGYGRLEDNSSICISH